MKIKLSALIVVAVALWFAVTPALADTFTVSGLLQGNVSFSGTLNINTANGAITSWNVALPAVSGLPALNFTPTNSMLNGFLPGPAIGCPSGTGFFAFDTGPVPGFQDLELALIIPEATLVGFAGAEIVPSLQCMGKGTPFTNNSAYVGVVRASFPSQVILEKVTSGSITLTPTAEPSGLFLLGTGLLAVGGAVLRKLFSCN